MLILILIDVLYSQKAVFSFGEGSNGQNRSSGSYHPVKKLSDSQNFRFTPPLLFTIWKTLNSHPWIVFSFN